MAPIQSKLVTVTLSESADKAIVRLLNRTSGDIWSEVVSDDTVIFDLANNNIWGDTPTQWVVGDVLEIIAYAEKKGETTHTLADGVNEPSLTLEADTAVQLIF